MTQLDLSMVRDRGLPKVVGVHPLGSLVLVELLTAQELTSDRIFVSDDVDVGLTPQAYVLELGPTLPHDLNLKVGQRVIVQGRGVPVPNYNGGKRQKMFVEYSMLKGVLDEERVTDQ